MKQKDNGKDSDKKDEQQTDSRRRHQTDEDLRREYEARTAYCAQCGGERPVGHYPHQ